MTAPTVVLDSGALDRATTNFEFRRVLRRLVENGCIPVVPAVVLAEAITGRPQDAATNQTIKRFDTVDTNQATARQAGALRHRANRSSSRRLPSAIDAIVAAHAVEVGAGFVFTTDPADLQRLLANHPKLHVESPDRSA